MREQDKRYDAVDFTDAVLTLAIALLLLCGAGGFAIAIMSLEVAS